MNTDYLSKKTINQFIKTALIEDLGDGDHTTLAAIPEKAHSRAQLLVKDEGIIAGLEMASFIFERIDASLDIDFRLKDGAEAKNNDIGFVVEGSARSILSGERLVLNCMQRMSGIATYTRQLTNIIKGTNAQLLDTRKTTPNFRIMEKWAVSIGGGSNHRFGLYDMILIKDNHIDFAGGIKHAIKATKKYLKDNELVLQIEIETRNLEEVEQVLQEGGVDVIMLDNMMPSDIRLAVKLIDGKYKTEASGGITEKTIRDVAETGVDYISVGALTHSIKSMDLSLKAIKE